MNLLVIATEAVHKGTIIDGVQKSRCGLLRKHTETKRTTKPVTCGKCIVLDAKDRVSGSAGSSGAIRAAKNIKTPADAKKHANVKAPSPVKKTTQRPKGAPVVYPTIYGVMPGKKGTTDPWGNAVDSKDIIARVRQSMQGYKPVIDALNELGIKVRYTDYTGTGACLYLHTEPVNDVEVTVTSPSEEMQKSGVSTWVVTAGKVNPNRRSEGIARKSFPAKTSPMTVARKVEALIQEVSRPSRQVVYPTVYGVTTGKKFIVSLHPDAVVQRVRREMKNYKPVIESLKSLGIPVWYTESAGGTVYLYAENRDKDIEVAITSPQGNARLTDREEWTVAAGRLGNMPADTVRTFSAKMSSPKNIALCVKKFLAGQTHKTVGTKVVQPKGQDVATHEADTTSYARFTKALHNAGIKYVISSSPTTGTCVSIRVRNNAGMVEVWSPAFNKSGAQDWVVVHGQNAGYETAQVSFPTRVDPDLLARLVGNLKDMYEAAV